MANQHHIVSSYDEELNRLNKTILQMGGIAESLMEQAIQALAKRDSALANEVVAGDDQVDDLEHQVANFAVRLLALRQPMANDLRNIVAALKISGDVERIADYACNIAKRSITLSQLPEVPPAHSIPRMGRIVQKMIKNVLDAFAQRSPELAISVWENDKEVDEIYTGIFRESLTYMMEDPRSITPCTHLLFIAKNIERIGDHATNVAEDVYFMVKGTAMHKDRPKADESLTANPGRENAPR